MPIEVELHLTLRYLHLPLEHLPLVTHSSSGYHPCHTFTKYQTSGRVHQRVLTSFPVAARTIHGHWRRTQYRPASQAILGHLIRNQVKSRANMAHSAYKSQITCPARSTQIQRIPRAIRRTQDKRLVHSRDRHPDWPDELHRFTTRGQTGCIERGDVFAVLIVNLTSVLVERD